VTDPITVKGAVSATSTVLKALKLVKTARDAAMTTGDQRLAEWIQEEVREAVFRRLPEVERKCQELIDGGVDVKLSDVAHIGNHVAKGWSTAADPKKRKILEDAFVRSFDRELYESGLLNTLWERLERLSYGDLFLLRDLVEAGEKNRDADREAVIKKHELRKNGGLGPFHAQNLVNEGVAFHPSALDSIRANELGSLMYKLAWEELPEPGAAVADAEAKP